LYIYTIRLTLLGQPDSMKEAANKGAFMRRLKERQLTQMQLAVEMGKSLYTVQAWATGKHVPTLSPVEMQNLCKLLDCSLDELAEMFPLKKANA
jgi:transcriptional regulator with XRE-family HTH domain